MGRPYMDWLGSRDDTADVGGGAEALLNCDLRKHGELRRRLGHNNRRSIGGSAAEFVYASGRHYIVSFNAGTLGATRVT